MHKLIAAVATALFALTTPAFAADAKKDEKKEAAAKKAEAKKEEKKEEKKEKKVKGGC